MYHDSDGSVNASSQSSPRAKGTEADSSKAQESAAVPKGSEAASTQTATTAPEQAAPISTQAPPAALAFCTRFLPLHLPQLRHQQLRLPLLHHRPPRLLQPC